MTQHSDTSSGMAAGTRWAWNVEARPTREALWRLDQEGLVEMISFKGGAVTGWARQDLPEISEPRELENVAAGRG